VRVRALLGLIRWYVRELTGDADYDRYLNRHQAHHPGEPALPRRDYERLRARRREEVPGSRCC
jgi:uncharacterized short protein YbdD (DUF466 family)